MSNIIGSTGFRMQHFTVRELLDRIDIGQLVGKSVPGKQWTKNKRKTFIESVLCGIPIASIYLDGCKPQWNIIDGVERLYTLKMYVDDELCLDNMKLLPEMYEGLFSELPPPIKRRFMNTPIIGYVLTTELEQKLLETIFERLNS